MAPSEKKVILALNQNKLKFSTAATKILPYQAGGKRKKENKKIRPIRGEKNKIKFNPYPNFLPPSWKSNNASLIILP